MLYSPPDWFRTELPKACSCEWGFVAQHKGRELRASSHGVSRYHDLFCRSCHVLRWSEKYAPPGGPGVDVFVNYDDGCCQNSRQHPQGARRRRLHQLRWWLLPELPVAPPEGPPLTSSSTTMVALAGAPGSTTRGPAIDVRLKTWYLSPAFLLRDTYQGATMANTTTAGQNFAGKYSLKWA
jgi:hypothetical protein